MATPFKDPRTGTLYFRRGIPGALRAAFDGREVVKVSLKTKDPLTAKAAFARENAAFEDRLADARRRLADGTLAPTPAALLRRWTHSAGVGTGLAATEHLIAALMELDAAVGVTGSAVGSASRYSVTCGPGGAIAAGSAVHAVGNDGDVYPPPISVNSLSRDWSAVHTSRDRYQAIIESEYGGDVERVGSNWIRKRWFEPEANWRPALMGPVARLRAENADAARFGDHDLTSALLATLDDIRTGDEAANRARLGEHRAPRPVSTLKPNLRLKTLFAAWKAGNKPRPQSANEYESAIDDFIDFAGDVPVAAIDKSMICHYRDLGANLPAAMPRADRALPFRQRVAKHLAAKPKVSGATLGKRVGAIKAMLSFAFEEDWIAANVGVGVKVKKAPY